MEGVGSKVKRGRGGRGAEIMLQDAPFKNCDSGGGEKHNYTTMQARPSQGGMAWPTRNVKLIRSYGKYKRPSSSMCLRCNKPQERHTHRQRSCFVACRFHTSQNVSTFVRPSNTKNKKKTDGAERRAKRKQGGNLRRQESNSIASYIEKHLPKERFCENLRSRWQPVLFPLLSTSLHGVLRHEIRYEDMKIYRYEDVEIEAAKRVMRHAIVTRPSPSSSHALLSPAQACATKLRQ